MNPNVTRIAEKLTEGGKNIIFSGAGISTESGIPDYRSQGGIWDKFRPVYFDEFMASREAREEYWRQKVVFYNDLINAQPNTAHRAICELWELGLLEAVITQNIDGLHQEAGLPGEIVIELHGNNRRVRCMGCDRISSIEAAHARVKAGDLAPECECGSYLKPDTISFGQAMLADEVEKAVALSRNSDTFMVIGSTLLVQPASHMPGFAKKNHAFLSIVNLSDTPCDALCDVLIRDKAGKTLQKILAEIKKIKGFRQG